MILCTNDRTHALGDYQTITVPLKTQSPSAKMGFAPSYTLLSPAVKVSVCSLETEKNEQLKFSVQITGQEHDAHQSAEVSEK